MCVWNEDLVLLLVFGYCYNLPVKKLDYVRPYFQICFSFLLGCFLFSFRFRGARAQMHMENQMFNGWYFCICAEYDRPRDVVKGMNYYFLPMLSCSRHLDVQMPKTR